MLSPIPLSSIPIFFFIQLRNESKLVHESYFIVNLLEPTKLDETLVTRDTRGKITVLRYIRLPEMKPKLK